MARRLAGVVTASLFAASVLLAEVPIVTAAPNSSPAPDPVDSPRTEPPGPVAREAVAVPLDIRDQGGAVGSTGLAPSEVELRPALEQTISPTTQIERTDLRTEHTRTVANPDGTYQLEASAGRLNYQAANGTWIPIDLTLRRTAAGPYGLEVTSLDRAVRFGGQTDVSLVSLGSTAGTVRLRALDFGGTVATDSPVGAQELNGPSPSPNPSTDQTVNPSPAPDASEAPSPGPSAEPSTTPSTALPSANPEPSAPTDPSPAPSPTAPGPPRPPDSVLGDNGVVFDGPAGLGRLFVGPTDTGFQFGLTLASPSDAASYSFALDIGDLTARLADDGRTILLERASHSEAMAETVLVGVVTAPVVLDANEVPAPPDTVKVSITTAADASISDFARASLAPSEIVVTYAIDPAWLADPARVFPVTLDPTACLGEGASGCTINGTGINFDHFVMSSLPTQHPTGWTTFRVGYDVRTDDGDVYGKMRGLAYFQDVALPDGAVMYDSNLELHISSRYGGPVGETIRVHRITTGWSQSSSWNDWSSGAGYATSPYASLTVPSAATGDNMNFDVDPIVDSWYTRRGKDWKGDLGFALKMVNEGSAYGEVEFDRSSDATASKRPKLVIGYELPKVSIDFAAALGPNYAPSTMIAGQATSLPLRITNNGSGFSFTAWASDPSNNWDAGYRWFDEKDNLVGSGTAHLAATIASGGYGDVQLPVTPPGAGAYVLRLDLVRTFFGTSTWASDWAKPSLFYSRNKKVLSSDNTRWVGSSTIERDEFPITVVAAGSAPGGETPTVATGDGGTLGLNLWSRALTYEGAGGIGFADRLPMDLDYGYDAKETDCTGILGACGWWTNWDERLTAGAASGDFTYQDPGGGRHRVDTDANGQLVSGAPLRLSRPRVTLWDEAGQATSGAASLVTAASEGQPAYSGQSILKAPSNASVDSTQLGFTAVELNTYRFATFAVKATSAASAGIRFKIHNVTDPTTYPDRWFVYTVGTAWVPTGFSYAALGGTINGPTWATYSNDLWTRVKADSAFGKPSDTFQVTSYQTMTANAGYTGSTYIDAWRLEPTTTTQIGESNPAWTTGTGTATSTDAAVGSYSVKIPSAAITSSPDCLNTGCTVTFDTAIYPFVHWSWKKVGGQSAAVVFHVKDTRSGAPYCYSTACDLTYYAGPTAPPGAANAIQVSDVVPAGWTQVTRNLLDDARQVFNLFNDNAGGSSPSAPPSQGPTPDNVNTTGFRVSGVDGTFLLIDDLTYMSVPDPALDELGHPTGAGDATFTYDFSATYRDGSIHSFNQHGLLERIADRDGNRIELDWTISPNVAGQAGYALATIHAPTDGSTAGGSTFDREIAVSTGGSAPRTVTFTEKLGTTADPITGRSTTFSVATTTSTASGDTYGVNDVIGIKPARQPTCAGTAPTGCVALSYTDTTTHRLQYLADPRKAATNDDRFEIAWTGADPSAILDRSHNAAALLRVANYAVAGSISPASRRVLWQDAAAARAGSGLYADLISDGRLLYEYIPLACTAGDCVTNPPTAPSASQLRAANEFDGIARVNATVTYRCPGVMTGGCAGTPAEVFKSRQATKAGAKVDNYNDPLIAGELAWTQTPDQYFASLKDTGGENPDLYRTEFAYDEYGRQTAVTAQAWNARPDYPAVIKSTTATTTALKGYWRLTETSGITATDQVSPAQNGTYTNGPTLNQPGPLLNDAVTKAPSFDGTNDYVVIPSTLGTVSGSWTVNAWIRPSALPDATIVARAFMGSRKGTTSTQDFSFAGTLWYNTPTKSRVVRVDVGDGNGAWLVQGFLAPFPSVAANRWYQVAIAVDATAKTVTVYVDGRQIGRTTWTAAGTPRLADATRLLKFGNNGRDSTSPDWFAGRIGEVGVWSQVLTPSQIAGQYLAGRSLAIERAGTSFDVAWHPTQSDDQFLASPGFESGITDWEGTGGIAWVPAAPDQYVHSGYGSFKTNQNGTLAQDVALVAGQTVRFQAWKRSSGTAQPRIKLDYWKRSSGTWTFLVDQTYPASTTWDAVAWDVPLPFDTDGRVRVTLTVAGAGASDAAYFDDVALFTTYARSTYTTGGAPLAGLPSAGYILAAVGATGGTPGEVTTTIAYAADTGAANGHPAIWPTTTVINDVAGPSAPDEDITSTVAYDAWGRPIGATDPDGVTTGSTINATSGANGYRTDIVTTTDGVGNPTDYAYDLVGNRTSVETPLGLVTATAYDLLGHAIEVTQPDTVVNRSTFDDYGFQIGAIANYVDGAPSGATGIDDVTTTFTYDALGRRTQTAADTGYAGALDAQTGTAYDLAGNPVAVTAYAGSGGTNERTTTNVFEVFSQSSVYYSRPAPSALKTAVVPAAAPAPVCPDVTMGTAYCTSAAVMPGPTGVVGSGLDPAGATVGVTDPYGIVTRTFRDLAGRPVFTIANYADGVFDPAAPAVDIVAATRYALNGQVEAVSGVRRYATDTADPTTVTAYDRVGRPTAITTYDAAGAAVAVTKTVYTKAGRVDRVAAPDAIGTVDANRAWTRTVYDKAGRAIRTIAHADITGGAQVSAENFEDGGITSSETLFPADAQVWTSGTAGVFTAAGGSAAIQTGVTSPKSGESRLAVTTGTGTNTGTEWALAGTFDGSSPAHTYKATAWLNVPSGTTVNLYLGTATDNATLAVAGTGAWVAATVSWTPTADRTGVVFAARRNGSGTAATFYLDDVTVWDDSAAGTNPMGRDTNVPTETVYDADGRIVRSILVGGVPGDPSLVTRTTYNAMSRPTAVVVNDVAGAGTGDTVTNLTTTTTYDPLGRATDVYDPTGTRARYELDRLSRQTSTILNYVDGTPSGPTASDDVRSTFAYDALAELIGYCPAVQVQLGGCDPASGGETQAWRWTFDAMGRMETQVPPDNVVSDLDTTVWAYEPGGRLASVTDQTASGTVGRHTDYTYDPLARPTIEKTYQGAGTGALKLQTTRTYLGDGQVSAVAFDGTGAGEGTDTLDLTYDAAGRPDQVKRSPTVLTDYAWNPDGTLATRLDETIGTSAFAFDWADRLITTDPPDAYASGTVGQTWRLDGLLATKSWPSGITATAAYDAAKRPTGLAFGTAGSVGQAFDRDGNATSETHTLTGVTGAAGAGTQSFTYDSLNRVTGSSGLAGYTRAYTYDLNGNRLTKTDNGSTTYTATYEATDQAKTMTKSGGTPLSFAYTEFGELTVDVEDGVSAVGHNYDIAGRLTGIDPPGTTNDATFALDALGRFKSRTIAGLTDTYGYVGTSETVSRIGNGSPVDSLVDASGSRLGVKVGSTVNWFLPDPHGNVAGSTSGTTVAHALRYDAYGQTLATGTAGGSPVATGYWKHQARLDIGPPGLAQPLYEAAARLYSPGLGAFTGLDTVMGKTQDPLSLNRYLYAQANPATLIDPTGHRPCERECEGPPTPAEIERSREVAVETAKKQKQEQRDDKPTKDKRERASDSNVTPAAKQQVDAMSPEQLRAYVDSFTKGGRTPSRQEYDHLYAICRLVGVSAEDCDAYAYPRDWSDLDGPVGTLVVAPLAALTVGAGAVAISQYFATHPDVARGTISGAQYVATDHAINNMVQRNVSPESVIRAIDTGQRFAYFQANAIGGGAWRTGFYDAASRLFVAAEGNVVVTVIPSASAQYVLNVSQRLPPP